MQRELEKYLREISAGRLAIAVAIDMNSSIIWGRNWKEQARK